MNIPEMLKACQGADDMEVVANLLITQATPSARKSMAVKWLITEAKRLNREDALEKERRHFRVQERLDRRRRIRQHGVEQAERDRKMAQSFGPPRGNRARRRWETETALGKVAAERAQRMNEAARKREEASSRRFAESIERATSRFAAELKAEWTEELLNSGFALPDGRMVLWGDATIEDHKIRRGLFMDNAHANLEGAARHEAAINELESSGVSTLRELVFEEAA